MWCSWCRMRQSTYENEDENENFVRKRNAIVTKTEDNTEAPQQNKEAPQQNKEAL